MRPVGKPRGGLLLSSDPPPGGALLMAHTLTSISIRRAIPRLRPHVGGSA
jgi:hypothetical protein